MGKAKTPKRGATVSSGPYDRPSKKQQQQQAQVANKIFKFNTSSYGQHILKNPGIAEQIVLKANLKPTDTVLEVGPGTGNLSMRILEKCKKLIAVEVDPRMAAEVTKRVQGKPEQRRLEILLGDVIKLKELPQFDVCISNTPYQISSPLVFKLLSMPNPPRTSVLMFQREFALRLTARPGDSLYCRLSVNAQFWAKIDHVLKVGKANFNPPPKVESSVVRIEPKLGGDRPNVSFEEWDGLLRICFNRRNKTLRASFGVKEVLSLLERNYRVWCSLNDIPLEDGDVDGDADDVEMDDDVETGAVDDAEDEWGGIMDLDDDISVQSIMNSNSGNDTTKGFFSQLKKASAEMPKTASKKKRTKVAVLIRNKIAKVLNETELGDQRAGKLDENAFLRLLFALNAEGVHFS